VIIKIANRYRVVRKRRAVAPVDSYELRYHVRYIIPSVIGPMRIASGRYGNYAAGLPSPVALIADLDSCVPTIPAEVATHTTLTTNDTLEHTTRVLHGPGAGRRTVCVPQSPGTIHTIMTVSTCALCYWRPGDRPLSPWSLQVPVMRGSNPIHVTVSSLRKLPPPSSPPQLMALRLSRQPLLPPINPPL